MASLAAGVAGNRGAPEGHPGAILAVVRCVDAATLDDGRLESLPLPSQVGRSRVAGIDVNRPRMVAVLQAVVALSSIPAGLRSRELAAKIRELTGQSEAEYGPRQASYDLKKLRGKGLVERVEKSRRYAATEPGLQTMAAVGIVREQVLKPILGTDREISASFEQEKSATEAGQPYPGREARAATSLGTLRNARSHVELGLWRGRAWRRRAGQAFELGERTWRTGPPPSSFAAGGRGPRQDGQAAKTKLLARSCLRFWTTAWGQRELAEERTGRWKSPARLQGLFKGGLDIPSTHIPFSSLRREHPIWTLDAPGRVTRWADRNLCLSSDSCLLE